MNRTKIEWADYTWNPVVGCRRGCRYCYAKTLNDRFKFVPVWEEPTFFPERLQEPMMVKKPSIIFVGSMCDLFSFGAESDEKRKVVQKVIDVAREGQAMHHTFMFLTKEPERYFEYLYPPNVWLGTSIESSEGTRHEKRMEVINGLGRSFKTFLSVEPITGHVAIPKHYSLIDLIIVGAMTGRNKVIPQRHWLLNLELRVQKDVFYKDNIRHYFPELPKGDKSMITENVINERL